MRIANWLLSAVLVSLVAFLCLRLYASPAGLVQAEPVRTIPTTDLSSAKTAKTSDMTSVACRRGRHLGGYLWRAVAREDLKDIHAWLKEHGWQLSYARFLDRVRKNNGGKIKGGKVTKNGVISFSPGGQRRQPDRGKGNGGKRRVRITAYQAGRFRDPKTNHLGQNIVGRWGCAVSSRYANEIKAIGTVYGYMPVIDTVPWSSEEYIRARTRRSFDFVVDVNVTWDHPANKRGLYKYDRGVSDVVVYYY